jgi:methylenetetrahydrofolate dehydrogenase (NADP+)/methenyltetrahydrofolate cyclohydrolase
MSAMLLDGKAEAERLLQRVAAGVQARAARGLPAPGLAVILLGSHPASAAYVRNKRNACVKAGICDLSRDLPESTTQAELLRQLAELNADPAVHGILVQLPLPAQIDADTVLAAIAPEKDVDGFHACNMGRLAQDKPGLRPCTPRGVMTLLAAAAVPLAGMDAVIVGRSNIVGRPMALELIAADCTVTVCHSRTRDLPARVAAADLVVAAIGKPGFVQGGWIKPGAAVIDVGINRGADGKLCGDVDFAPAAARAGWITPVPGGVGPMTVATLMENTLAAAGG